MPRTIRNWRKKNAPFEEPQAMPAFIESQRARRGVSKFTKRTGQLMTEVLASIVQRLYLKPMQARSRVCEQANE